MNLHREKLKHKILEYKIANPCRCGENVPEVLEFHHCCGKKSFNISDAISNGYGWSRIEEELKKCIVVCRNCHAKIHWKETYKLKVSDTSVRGSKEHRQKLSEASKGKPGFWKNKTLSEETKKKMSIAKLGKKFSDEHKKALSLAHKKHI